MRMKRAFGSIFTLIFALAIFVAGAVALLVAPSLALSRKEDE